MKLNSPEFIKCPRVTFQLKSFCFRFERFLTGNLLIMETAGPKKRVMLCDLDPFDQ